MSFTNSTLAVVSMSEIRFSKLAVRGFEKKRKPEDIENMCNSIKSKGVLQPIQLLRATEDKGLNSVNREFPAGTLVMLNGQQRYECSKLVGKTEIPARIFENLTDTEILEIMLETNVHTVAMSKGQIKDAILKMLSIGTPFAEISAKLSIPVKRVEDWIGIAGLPEEVQKKVESGDLSIQSALNLVAIKKSDRFSDQDFENLSEKALELSARDFQVLLDTEKVNRDTGKKGKKQTEYVHVPHFNRERADEQFAKVKVILDSAEVDERPLSHDEEIFIECINYIFESSPQDITKKRLEWEAKHKKD